MLNEFRNLFLRALKCDDGITATVLVNEWNEAVKRVQAVFDNMTSKTVDAVPVVRCKDCGYFAEAKVNGKGFLICPASGMEITDNDYCSYGERKGGNE